MVKFSCLLLKVLSIVYFCDAIKRSIQDAKSVDASKVNDIIPDLYNLYLEVIKKDEKILARRIFRDNRQYMVHIERLRDVNGVKTHNLIVTDENITDEPLIYINNPVESNIPFSYLNKEQFKKELVKGIKKRKEEFDNQKYKKHSETVKHTTVIKRTTKLINEPKIINVLKIATKKVAITRKNTKKHTTTVHTFPEILVTSPALTTTTVVQVDTEKTSTIADSTTSTYESTTVSNDIEVTEVESSTVSKETEVPETEVPETEAPETEEPETEAPETETTTVTTTKSTPRTRGRPYVFMGRS